MQTYPDHKALRVIAFDEQQLELVDENAYELQLRTHKTRMDLGITTCELFHGLEV